MRCFVAVDLSDATRDAVAAAMTTLREAGRNADIGWTEPTKLHLTLEFLGEVADETRTALGPVLSAVASRHEPFVASAGGVGVFPSRPPPRVLWAGLTGGLRAIGLLAADVERACVPLGFPLATWPFRGHVTIGRVRSPRGFQRLVGALDAMREEAFGSWTVREIVLYRSHLHGSVGSAYEPLARYGLGGAAAADRG